MEARREAEEGAIAWRLRLREAGGDDWMRFAAWLEADPLNAEAYEAVSLADAEAPETLEKVWAHPAISVEPAPRLVARMPVRKRRWGVYGAGMSAAVALAFAMFLGVQSFSRVSTSIVATGPGQQRAIALTDGTRIALNGDTRLMLDSRRPRSVELLAGEANFTVRHDPAAPFEVLAGETHFRDIGTSFNVVRVPGAVDVSVASGAVLLNPDTDHVELGAGDALHDPDGPGVLVKTHGDPARVGGWRSGRLVFAHATLAEVAASIARSTGVAVTVAPAIAGRGFDGVIIVRGDREALFRRLGPLLGVSVERAGGAVRLVPLSRAAG